MKQKTFLTISIIALALSFALSSATVHAQGLNDLTNQAAGAAGFETNIDVKTNFSTIVGITASFFLSIMGVIFMTYAVFGGYLWMTAGGNEERLTKARKILRDGIVGLVIVFSAAGIYYFVKEGLGLIDGARGRSSVTTN